GKVGGESGEATEAVGVTRSVVGAARSSVTVPLDDPRELHRIDDPDAGDTLIVVTALAPARGFLKAQTFVEFRVLASTHGVVVQPMADDITAQVDSDKVIVTRPTGLTLSATATSPGGQEGAYQRSVFDPQSWGADRGAKFVQRESELMNAAADAPESRRMAARANLARFFLANDMMVEAKAVLDVALADSP